MSVDLGGSNVGVAEKRLEDTQIRPTGKQVRSESVAEHVRTDALRRYSRVGGHRPHDLEQPHSAEVRFAAREQPRGSARHELEPTADRTLRAPRDGHQPLLPTLASDHQE